MPRLSSLLLVSLVATVFSQTVVNTTSGPVSTTVVQSGITIFRGIPFGSAPRFARAVLANYSQTTINATLYGPECAQATGGSEDCLSVNIWAPTNYISADPNSKKIEVLVWIYGGGFVEGRSSSPSYDLTRVATFSQDVVFVSFNYRVGPFGFLTTPESGGGNWGLTDQILALQWVQQNIGAFGGDSTKVTIMGQSAGSISVCLLVNSPLATGLFRGAIMDEGPCSIVVSNAAQQSLSAIFVNATGCAADSNEMACLRNKTLAELLLVNYEVGGDAIFGKYGGPMWQPCIDGYVIPKLPLIQMANGDVPSKVPIMTGTTTGSMTLFMFEEPKTLIPKNASQLHDIITKSTNNFLATGNFEPEGIDAIIAYYQDLSNFNGDLITAAAQYLSDSSFICGTTQQVDLLSKAGLQTHFWVFNYTSPCFRSWGSNYCPPLPDWVGAFHGSDLAWWFNSTVPASSFDADLRVSMMGALRSFVKTQNPNPMYLLEPEVWNPQDSGATPAPLIIQNPFTFAESFRQEQCTLWTNALSEDIRNQIPTKSFKISRNAIIGIAIGAGVLALFILVGIGHIIKARIKRKTDLLESGSL